ncbi:MAG: ferric reductase-like transmembrane domain-containing protein [Cellvibrionaceae bacterium]|nr:ferric reductase-like transmembrane domain-containing protein [Cellvibrionaceae bacterium]
MTYKNKKPEAAKHKTLSLLLFFLGSLCVYLLMPYLSLLFFEPVLAGSYWDLLNGVGFVAFGLCIYLFIERARPRSWPKLKGDLFYWWHRLLAFALLLLSSIHGFGFLILEPVTWEYLSLRSPWYMLCAWLAWLFFVYLCLASIRPLKQRLHGGFLSFRFSHALLSILALVACLYHVVAAGFYFDRYAAWALFSLLLVLVVSYYALNRLGPKLSFSKILFGRDSKAHSQVGTSVKPILFIGLVLLCVLFSGGLYVAAN